MYNQYKSEVKINFNTYEHWKGLLVRVKGNTLSKILTIGIKREIDIHRETERGREREDMHIEMEGERRRREKGRAMGRGRECECERKRERTERVEREGERGGCRGGGGERETEGQIGRDTDFNMLH